MPSEKEQLTCALALVKVRRDGLQGEMNRLQGELTRLQGELDRASAGIVALEETIAAEPVPAISTESVGSAPSPSAEGKITDKKSEIPPNYSKMKTGDAASVYLREKGPMGTRELLDALVQTGVRFKSNNPYRLLYNTLDERARREDTDLKKVNGKWEHVARPKLF